MMNPNNQMICGYFNNFIKGIYMKTLLRFLLLTLFFVFTSKVPGQVSNLLVNGTSTHFTMASGNEISWSYNLSVGDTALLEIWLDVNSNTVIDQETDVLWQSFYQIDGGEGQNGPPDIDGETNGEISFAQPVGLAPSDYVMSFSNNDSTVAVSGTVTPIDSPVFTISGNITVPQGKSAQYLLVSLESYNEQGGSFWDAITDADGNFEVQMGGDTSGNPWRLKIDNVQSLSPAVQSPAEIFLTLDSSVAKTYSGNDFTFTESAAEINGTVRDENGSLLIGTDVYLSGNDGNFNRNVRTDNTGTFRIGFLSGELPASDIELGAGYSENNSIISASTHIQTVNSGDIFTRDLTIYQTNSTISGTVTLDGNLPNMNLEMMAVVSDTGYVRTFTDYNGNYTFNVSNKLYNYDISLGQSLQNYMGYSITAHPGETGVNFNFTMTDVEEDQSVVPNEFLLMQNYPNPFNPSTLISYKLKETGNVQLKVYNILGDEVATLVNELKPAGNYEITWQAVNLPSGIYFYRLQAGSFTDTKKMLLLK